MNSQKNKITTPMLKPLTLAIAGLLSTTSMVYAADDSPDFDANKTTTLQQTEVKDTRNQYQKEPSSFKLTKPLLETPKTIQIVTSDVLEDQGITSVNDALRNIAGVSTFGAGEGGGGNITTADVVTIRGFNSNESIYIDGVRDVAGYSRDAFNLEALEVSKGSSGSINGKGSAGGTVNIVTKHARQGEKHQVTAAYDTADMLRLTADINHSFTENVAGRVNFLYSNGGDYLGNGFENYKTLGFAPSLEVLFGDRTKVLIDVFMMKQDNNPVIGLPFIDERAAAALNLPAGPIAEDLWDNFYGVRGRDFEEVDTFSTTLVVSHDVSDDITLRSQTRYGTNERQSIISRPRIGYTRERDANNEWVYTYSGMVNLDLTRDEFEENNLFVTQFDALMSVDTGGIQHDLVAGIEYYRENQKLPKPVKGFTLSEDAVDLQNPNPNVTVTGALSFDGVYSDITGKGTAFYLLDTITFSPQWMLTGGLRYEQYEAAGQTAVWERVNGSWTRKPYQAAADSDFMSWNLGLVFKPMENLTLYASAADSQEPPASSLAFSGWRPSQIDGRNALDPQSATTYEVGGKWGAFDDQLLVSAALFQTTREVYDQDENGQEILGGEQQAKGFELSAIGRLSDEFNLIATYAHQDTEVTKDYAPPGRNSAEGNGLSSAPKNSGSVWLTYANNNLMLGGGLVYSSGNTFWRRQRAYFESGEYTLLNFMAGYQFNDQWKVQFNLDNATDETYITDYSARGHFRPGRGRVARVSVNYDF